MSILHNPEMKNVCYVEVDGNTTATEFSKIIKKFPVFTTVGLEKNSFAEVCSFLRPSTPRGWGLFHCSSAQLGVEQFVSDRQTQLIDF